MSHHRPESEISNQQLVAMVLAGNVAIYREVVVRFESKLAAYLARKCGNHSLVEDVLQETFIAVYHKLDSYNSDYDLGAWIFGIARNKCNAQFRKLRPHTEVSLIETVDTITPLVTLEQSNAAEYFWLEAKQLLSEDGYQALWLRYQESLSVKDIAHALSLSESNIKVLLYRARKTLAGSKNLANLSQPSLTQTPSMNERSIQI